MIVLLPNSETSTLHDVSIALKTFEKKLKTLDVKKLWRFSSVWTYYNLIKWNYSKFGTILQSTSRNSEKVLELLKSGDSIL